MIVKIKYANVIRKRAKLTEQIRKLVKKQGGSLVQRNIIEAHKKQPENYVSLSTFKKHLGPMREIRIAAGLPGGRRVFQLPKDEEKRKTIVLILYKDLSQKLGKTATYDDVNAVSKAGRCPSARTCHRVFGTFRTLQQVAGMKWNRRGRGKKAA